MRPLLRDFALLGMVAASSAGCGGSTDPRVAVSPAAGPAGATSGGGAIEAPPRVSMPAASTPPTSGEAPPVEGRWLLRETYPPTATWGVPDSEGILTFSCDRGRRQLVMQRQATGVADGVRMVSLDADGTRMDYPAERIEATLAPAMVTPIALDAPILDRLLAARRIRIVAGGDAVVAAGPGAALAAVVDACRREADGTAAAR